MWICRHIYNIGIYISTCVISIKVYTFIHSGKFIGSTLKARLKCWVLGNPADTIPLPSWSLQMLKNQANSPNYVHMCMYLIVCMEEVYKWWLKACIFGVGPVFLAQPATLSHLNSHSASSLVKEIVAPLVELLRGFSKITQRKILM